MRNVISFVKSLHSPVSVWQGRAENASAKCFKTMALIVTGISQPANVYVAILQTTWLTVTAFRWQTKQTIKIFQACAINNFTMLTPF